MKALTPDQLHDFFAALATTYEVRLPILLSDGTRALGLLDDGPLALHGGTLPPADGGLLPAARPGLFRRRWFRGRTFGARHGFLVAGFTAHDLACLRFIDRFFADGFRDTIYFRQRQEAFVVGVSGYCGGEGSLLPLAGGDCDLELVWDGNQWLVIPYTEVASALMGEAPDTAEQEVLARIEEDVYRRPARCQ